MRLTLFGITLIIMLVGCKPKSFNNNDFYFEDEDSLTEEIQMIPDNPPADPQPPEINTTLIEDPVIPEDLYNPNDIPEGAPPKPDIIFAQRIIFPDGKPYRYGKIRITTKYGHEYAYTNGNGKFSVNVVSDLKFILGAWSPFGDEIYYSYAKPLLINSEDKEHIYDCPLEKENEECYKEPALGWRPNDI